MMIKKLTIKHFKLLPLTCLVIFSGCASAGLSSPAEVARKPTSLVSGCGDLQTPIKRGDIQCLAEELIKLRFPELENAWSQGRIVFREFNSSSYYLKSAFLAGRLSRDTSQKKYSIDVNPKIYELDQLPSGPPSAFAIQGILSHELIHILDYETLSSLEIIKLAAEIGINPKVPERSTDARAFERGYAEGIKSYRVWIYGKLSPAALKVKRKRYYTPEEIDQWILDHQH